MSSIVPSDVDTTVRVFRLTCGWMRCDAGAMVAGDWGDFRFPIPAFLVDHPDGLVLIDAGLHPSLAGSPERIGALAETFTIELADEHLLENQLSALGVRPSDVTHLAFTHLHFDHCGATATIPDATLLVQQAEWDMAHDERAIAKGAYNPDDFDHGHFLHLYEGELDLFGDETVVLFPTPGHTPGHQSVRLRTETGGDIVVCGDACYLRRSLELLKLPPTSHNRARQLDSMALLASLRAGGAELVFGHDPEQWAALPATW